MEQYLSYSQEVLEAKEKGLPIVALESTIISHGMPYPQNVKTAREVEQIIRDGGAVPATIALIDGKIKIGLSDEELEMFGNAQGVAKASRRDIGYLLATKKIGATTVAATMICAELEELAMTNVAVVCAGAKSILDIGLTLEYLETKGVPVIGFGTDILPAFYTRESDFNVNFRADSAEETAAILRAKWDLGLRGGALVANPIPVEDSMEADFINGIIENALQEAAANGIAGKNVTPFLLGKVKELTQGKSLEANIALVKNNARVGAKIAVELQK